MHYLPHIRVQFNTAVYIKYNHTYYVQSTAHVYQTEESR